MALDYVGRYGQDDLHDQNGAPLRNRSTRVYLLDGITPAVLYVTDGLRSGTLTRPQPISTDANANLEFFAVPGDYIARVEGAEDLVVQVGINPLENSVGTPGAPGGTGLRGPIGLQGIPGNDGATGPPGLTWQGGWSMSTVYHIDDTVEYLGSAYIAVIASTNSIPFVGSPAWSLLALKGDTGLTGATGAQGVAGPLGPIGLVWRGAWNLGNPYVYTDAVRYNGSAYYALRASTNAQPDVSPADWSLLAQKGDTGAQGVQGIPGNDGQGVPPGGTAAQVLGKVSGTDFDDAWIDAPPSPCFGNASPFNIETLCRLDGSVVLLLIEQDCATGTTFEVGFIDPLTGVFTAGPPPSGTSPCSGHSPTGFFQGSAVAAAVANAATTTVAVAWNELDDPAGLHGSGLPTRLVADRAGLWAFSAALHLLGGAGATARFTAGFRRNGDAADMFGWETSTLANIPADISRSFIIKLEPQDFVEFIIINQNVVGGYNWADGSTVKANRLSVRYLGASS